DRFGHTERIAAVGARSPPGARPPGTDAALRRDGEARLGPAPVPVLRDDAPKGTSGRARIGNEGALSRDSAPAHSDSLRRAAPANARRESSARLPPDSGHPPTSAGG